MTTNNDNRGQFGSGTRNNDNASAGGMSVREAGRRGGEATSASHGHEFYEDIGQKGGEKGGQRVSELVEKGKQAEGGRGNDNR